MDPHDTHAGRESRTGRPTFDSTIERHHRRFDPVDWDDIYIVGDVHGCSDERYLIGSADWMVRNFEHRVEAVTPVMDLNLSDNWLGWEMRPNGSYDRLSPDGDERVDTHARLMATAETAADER